MTGGNFNDVSFESILIILHEIYMIIVIHPKTCSQHSIVSGFCFFWDALSVLATTAGEYGSDHEPEHSTAPFGGCMCVCGGGGGGGGGDICVRDHFVRGLKSLVRIFYPSLARKSSGFAQVLLAFWPENGHLKDSRGMSPPPPSLPLRAPMGISTEFLKSEFLHPFNCGE